jgi:hypothetical protein
MILITNPEEGEGRVPCTMITIWGMPAIDDGKVTRPGSQRAISLKAV